MINCLLFSAVAFKTTSVVAVDMNRPTAPARVLTYRWPVVGSIDWPRRGDELRAGIVFNPEGGSSLWFGRIRRFPGLLGGAAGWSPSGRFFFVRWLNDHDKAITVRVFHWNGRLVATRVGKFEAIYWAYRGDALILREAPFKRSVWSAGKVPKEVRSGQDRMDQVYRQLLGAIAKEKRYALADAEYVVRMAKFNSVVGAATWSDSSVHLDEDGFTYVRGVLIWAGADSTWRLNADEEGGGFTPVADGWACGPAKDFTNRNILLLKPGRRVIVPAPGDVVDQPILYVHKSP